MNFKPLCVSWAKYSFSITLPLQKATAFCFLSWGGQEEGPSTHKLSQGIKASTTTSSMVSGRCATMLGYFSVWWSDRPHSGVFRVNHSVTEVVTEEHLGQLSGYFSLFFGHDNQPAKFQLHYGMQEKVKFIHQRVTYLLISINQVSQLRKHAKLLLRNDPTDKNYILLYILIWRITSLSKK